VDAYKAQKRIPDPRKQGSFPGKKVTDIGPIFFSHKSLFRIIRDHLREFSVGLIERICLGGETQIKAECLPLAVLVF